MTEVREQALTMSRQMVDDREVAQSLAAFDPVWETRSPKEQARVVHLLIERVEYDGERARCR